MTKPVETFIGTRMLGRTRHIHFVGVGGIGMSGIAGLLVNPGYVVSGSDAKSSEVTSRLARLGVEVHEGYEAIRTIVDRALALVGR